MDILNITKGEFNWTDDLVLNFHKFCNSPERKFTSAYKDLEDFKTMNISAPIPNTLKGINPESVSDMKNMLECLLNHVVELRDYYVRETQSFEGSERQMFIDLAAKATSDIEESKAVLKSITIK